MFRRFPSSLLRIVLATALILGALSGGQFYEVAGVRVRNIEVVIAGTTQRRETIVVGAHYDSSIHGPGANDNGSGSAAPLELACLLRSEGPVCRGDRHPGDSQPRQRGN